MAVCGRWIFINFRLSHFFYLILVCFDFNRVCVFSILRIKFVQVVRYQLHIGCCLFCPFDLFLDNFLSFIWICIIRQQLLLSCCTLLNCSIELPFARAFVSKFCNFFTKISLFSAFTATLFIIFALIFGVWSWFQFFYFWLSDLKSVCFWTKHKIISDRPAWASKLD